MDRSGSHPYDCAAMARVHPQDCLDVLQAARRDASYEFEFDLSAVVPVRDLAGLDPAIAAGDVNAQPAPVAPLSRLAGAVESLKSVALKIAFAIDDFDRPVMRGRAVAQVELPCQRCLLAQPVRVTVELATSIWLGTEPSKEAVLGEMDTFYSPTSSVAFGLLIEDDLLLALPQQVCALQDCPRAPTLAYPASVEAGGGARTDADAKEDDLPDDRQRPFAGLKDLLDGQPEG